MNHIQETVYNIKIESANDEEFIEKIEALSLSAGSAVYTAIFKILAGINVSEQDGVTFWQTVVEHRQELIRILGRHVDITTALSDFLQTSTNHLFHPRLIETTAYENVIKDTIYDPLTGLFNRQYFDETFAHQASLAKRYQTDLAVLFLDIDNFKDVNDNYGHLFGDEVLKQTAQLISQAKRESDVVARFGGEEFILLMPHTDSISAFIVAERIRLSIEKNSVAFNQITVKITISGGLASYPLNSEKPEKLLDMADCALYLAKGAGKNKISYFKKEKRRYLRVKISKPVIAKELDFKNSLSFTGTSKDIGIGGILFENDQPLPIGSLLKLKVPTGDGSFIFLIGNVVRVEAFADDRYDIGMTTTFTEMAKVANQEITTILHNQDNSSADKDK